MNIVWLMNLATVPYADALTLQHRIVDARKRGALNDTLLLLEHHPVFTLGRNANDSNILASREFLQQIGIQVFQVERGGDVTYHGPGQLVGYPILDLHNFRMDVGWFVHSLEETLIRTLADFGIRSKRIEKLVGVWVDVAPLFQSPLPTTDERHVENKTAGDVKNEAKIAQIGARIEQFITYHGMALNVDPNLMHFDLIVPCGIADKAVTSMTRVLQQPVDMLAVRERMAARFAEVFDIELIRISPEEFETRLEDH